MRLYEHDLGLSWVCDDGLERASHALADGGRVWFVDPVDEREAMERAAGLGTPAGVIQLLDRHARDGEAIAGRLGVPLERLPAAVPDSPFTVIGVLDVPGWREVALWWGERRALAVAEVVGTSPHATLGAGAAGIHPMLRLLPPGSLRSLRPEHLLPGHGAPLHGPEAAEALERAYARSRRDIPRLVRAVPALLRAGR